jgi:hypothetical protein
MIALQPGGILGAGLDGFRGMAKVVERVHHRGNRSGKGFLIAAFQPKPARKFHVLCHRPDPPFRVPIKEE